MGEIFKKLQTADRKQNENNKRLERTINKLASAPSANEQVIDDVALTPGSINLVEHNLGRAFENWSFIDMDGSAVVSRVRNDVTADEARFVALETTVTVTGSLRIF